MSNDGRDVVGSRTMENLVWPLAGKTPAVLLMLGGLDVIVASPILVHIIELGSTRVLGSVPPTDDAWSVFEPQRLRRDRVRTFSR